MYVLIVKHIKNEGPGTIADFLDEKGIARKTVCMYAKERLLDKYDDMSAVVVLGGPMNVYEEDKYPYLKDEDTFIENILRKNIPFFGVCLGAQLLAKACGARVYNAENEEIGLYDVELCDVADKTDLGIFRSAPKTFPTVQWHGDTFDVPDGGRLLVTSKTCKNQAFVVNGNAYGLQFHIEVDEELVRDWFDDLPNGDDIITDFLSIKKDYDPIAREIYKHFFQI